MAKMGHFSHGILQCAPTLTSIQNLFHPNSRQTPLAAVTVYSAPEDGRKGRPKHVGHTCCFLINTILPELHRVGLLYITHKSLFMLFTAV